MQASHSERTHFRGSAIVTEGIRFNQEDCASGASLQRDSRSPFGSATCEALHEQLQDRSHRVPRPRHDILLPKLQIRKCTSTSERSRSTLWLVIRNDLPGKHAEIEPLPQPTSSVLAPDLTTSSD